MTIALLPGSALLCSYPSGCGGWNPLNGWSMALYTVGGGFGSLRSLEPVAKRVGRIVWIEVIVMATVRPAFVQSDGRIVKGVLFLRKSRTGGFYRIAKRRREQQESQKKGIGEGPAVEEGGSWKARNELRLKLRCGRESDNQFRLVPRRSTSSIQWTTSVQQTRLQTENKTESS